MNVSEHRGQILIRIDQDGLVAAPKQRAVAPMAPVESLGVDSIHMAHHPGQIALRCSKTQVVVVPHQRVAEDFDSPQPMGFGESVEKGSIVGVHDKHGLSCRSPVHDVIHRLGKLNSQWTGHG